MTDGSQARDADAGSVLKNRVVDAWRGRVLADGTDSPVLVLVGGYAGEKVLATLGGDQHDRHSDLYLNEVRPLECKCPMDTAFDNIDCGISTILTAPFITELNDPAWLNRLTNRCKAKGMGVAAIWVRCDIDSMREYIEFRDAPRDAWKLEHWDDYARGIDTATSPPSVHLTIDNRQGAAISIADQTREALRKILG
ncbi:hypothetical protein [Actinomadura xylanilytica]|uniref:hypothetical protein n=1 Tax=Actinomadura xylanilytica TaxID=887459 RepID=UPI00255AD824|nr:hypothetical protein [Actinomadura xylanilytica]MDL4773620.1 hypothetical protein [Actinomadura xylanilytica]